MSKPEIAVRSRADGPAFASGRQLKTKHGEGSRSGQSSQTWVAAGEPEVVVWSNADSQRTLAYNRVGNRKVRDHSRWSDTTDAQRERVGIPEVAVRARANLSEAGDAGFREVGDSPGRS